MQWGRLMVKILKKLFSTSDFEKRPSTCSGGKLKCTKTSLLKINCENCRYVKSVKGKAYCKLIKVQWLTSHGPGCEQKQLYFFSNFFGSK